MNHMGRLGHVTLALLLLLLIGALAYPFVKQKYQERLTAESSLEEAQRCVEENCHSTLKKMGLNALSLIAKELSDEAAFIMKNSKVFVCDYPYLERIREISFVFSSKLKIL